MMQFMQSDKVVEIFTDGLYLNSPTATYLLPPTKTVMEKKMRENEWYAEFGRIFVDDSKLQVPFVIDGFM